MVGTGVWPFLQAPGKGQSLSTIPAARGECKGWGMELGQDGRSSCISISQADPPALTLFSIRAATQVSMRQGCLSVNRSIPPFLSFHLWGGLIFSYKTARDPCHPHPSIPKAEPLVWPSEQGVHELGDEGSACFSLIRAIWWVCVSTRGVNMCLCGGFLSSHLWFQFPVLRRIRAQEAEALGKRVPTGPLGMSWLWMFLQFSPMRAPLQENRQDPPLPILSAPEWIKLPLVLGAGMDTLAHARVATLPVAWGHSPSPPPAHLPGPSVSLGQST